MNLAKNTSLAVTLFISLSLSSQLMAQDVEVYLLDRIDAILNHYCLDVNGPPHSMQLETPLQAHTCYSYTGELTADQAIESEDIATGKIRIKSVNLCAQLDGNEPGATITLADCADSDEQSFELRENGQISPTAYPELCLTAGPTSWLGGQPGNLNENQARTLHMQRCGDEALRYQRWGTRTQMPAQ